MYQTWPEERNRLFRRRILRWFAANRRAFPWRRNPTPYRTWVAEVMLQQTQARTVVPYYRRFMQRFPTLTALAAAPPDEVLAHWAGLGYYRRAHSLHSAARMMARDFGGRIPASAEQLRRLPGVGRYIAGAVLSIAFGRPEPVVDGNVRRVVRRLLGMQETAPESFYWRQAEAWIPRRRAGDFNQAVMELGAVLCTPAHPRCPICPAADLCAARARGLQDSLRRRGRPVRQPAVRLSVLVLECRRRLLLARHRDLNFIPGEWGLPAKTLGRKEHPRRAARELVRKLTGRSVPLEALGTFTHAITRRRIETYAFGGRFPVRPPTRDGVRWVRPEELERLLVSSLFRKACGIAGGRRTQAAESS